MDAKMIRENIRELISHGETSYENCERIILLKEALKCLEEEPKEADYAGNGRDDGEEGPLKKDQIVGWVGAIKNADGTHGGHWTMEQTEQARKQRSIDCDPVEFYAAMNMMYSDYCKVAEKVGASSVDFYAYMAKAFLEDKDARPHKLSRYYRFIAEK